MAGCFLKGSLWFPRPCAELPGRGNIVPKRDNIVPGICVIELMVSAIHVSAKKINLISHKTVQDRKLFLPGMKQPSQVCGIHQEGVQW